MHIWVPRRRFLEVPSKAPLGSLGGYFKIEGRLDDGRSRVLCDWQPNLITDIGLERPFVSGGYLGNCQVGTGNTTPTYGDTSLAALARNHTSITSNTAGAQASAPYYGWNRLTYRFNPPGSNINIAEIGIGWSSGSGTLFSRALTKDINGNPAAVTWLAAETLDVSYELRRYPWLNDVAYDDVISGSHYTGVWRASQATSALWSHNINSAHSFAIASAGQSPAISFYDGSIGSITSVPSSQILSVLGYNTTTNTYVAGSHKITGSITIGATTGYSITAMQVVCSMGCGQKSITPALVKPVDWTLVLNMQTGVAGRYA